MIFDGILVAILAYLLWKTDKTYRSFYTNAESASMKMAKLSGYASGIVLCVLILFG